MLVKNIEPTFVSLVKPKTAFAVEKVSFLATLKACLYIVFAYFKFEIILVFSGFISSAIKSKVFSYVNLSTSSRLRSSLNKNFSSSVN